MTVVTIDVETYWSDTYTLRRMSEVDYILSPLFQVIGVSIKRGDGPITWVAAKRPDDPGPDPVRVALAEIDWDNAAMLSHNMRFDGSILAWHYGHKPRLYLDTLCMARAVTHAKIQSSALAALADYFKLPPKGDEVLLTKGKRREGFSDSELKAFGEYCAHDSFLCRTIFDIFMDAHFPKSELEVIDASVRMFIDHPAQLDMHKLAIHLHGLEVKREILFSNIDKKQYTSNDKFAALLDSLNVRVPIKLSPTTGKWIPALSRNDVEFKRLCDDADQSIEVQAHLAIRKGAKSVIEETRTRKMLELAKLDWYLKGEYQGRGWIPVPYLYYGAHTGRFSGTAGFNFANLPRESPIREAIIAPEGMRIVHRDASQIECRVLAALAGCETLLRGFREGRDVYCDFASQFYKRPITKEHKRERFTGKTAVLSLGYQSGWLRLKNTLFLGQGGQSVDVSNTEANDLVNFYRTTFEEIPTLWATARKIIMGMAGVIQPNKYAIIPAISVKYDKGNTIRLPNGLALRYPDLNAMVVPYEDPSTLEQSDRTEFRYQGYHKGEVTKLYGGMLVENITQALARIIVTDVMRRVHHRTGKRPFMGTYDSWDYVIPESEVEAFDHVLEEEFTRAPIWLPTVPLASEGGWGRSLAAAEKRVNE